MICFGAASGEVSNRQCALKGRELESGRPSFFELSSLRSSLGFSLIVNDYLGFFRDSNSQLFGDYSIYFLGINDYLASASLFFFF